MMDIYERVYASIDLDAVVHNLKALQEGLPSGCGVMGVVKADGYGHGAVPVAKAIEPYVEGYAVAAVQEAAELQNHGISKPILILGAVPKASHDFLVERGIRTAVFTMEQAKSFSEAALRHGKEARLHLALDTGMSRIGLEPTDAGADLAAEMSLLPGIVLEGLFTHFARADERDKSLTLAQYDRYLDFVKLLRERGLSIPVHHVANSAAMMELKETGCDMVRAGIAMYGYYPSEEMEQDKILLKPAMELRSFVTYVKTIEPGTAVSYGGTFVADHPMRVATVSVGYGDGYPRNLSGKGRALIHGKPAPILGRVCMDQMMVDVTDIPDCKEEDLVTLIGRDGDEFISVEEVAATCGGFHYEILCGIGKRVPRRYLQNGTLLDGEAF